MVKYIILLLFVSVTANAEDLNGVWDTKQDMLVFIDINKSNEVFVMLMIEKVIVKVPLTGDVVVNKYGITLMVKTPKLQINKECYFETTLTAAGKLKKELFITNASLFSMTDCIGKRPITKSRNISGKWKKIIKKPKSSI